MRTSLRVAWATWAACGVMSGCSLSPSGPAAVDALSDGRDACAERSEARRERTEELLGRAAPVTRRDDPLAPANIAANAAQDELLNCLRTSR